MYRILSLHGPRHKWGVYHPDGTLLKAFTFYADAERFLRKIGY